MEPFDDTSLRLSFFNSIFELLAGYNLAYAGLEIISNFINSYIFRSIKVFKLTDQYFIDKRAYYNSISSRSEELEPLDSHLNKLNGIINKYKSKHKSKVFLKVRVKIKFIPLFLYCGFYCFYVLLLSGLSETQKIIFFQGDIFSLGLKGVYSIRGHAFFVLFLFNILSFSYLFSLAIRNWDTIGLNNRIKVISAPPLFLFATIFFILSIIVSILFRFYLNISPNDSLFFELFTVLWSIVICLSPILALSFWGFIGYKVKDSVYSDVSKEIESTLKSALTANFLRSSQLENKPQFQISIYENKAKFRRLLYNRFLKLYRWQFTFVILSFGFILFLLNRFMISNDNELINYVRLSVNKEFLSYQSLPRIDTSWFDNYYTKNSTVRKRISERLLYHFNNKEIITNKDNRSNFEFISGRIINITNERIIIETNELWLTRWFDTDSKKYSYQFKEQKNDPQTYILKKENGKWLIDKSETLGHSEYLK